MHLYGKALRVTFLVFIPFIIAICSFIYGYFNFGALSSDHATFALVCALACYVIVIVYGIYPIIFTAKKNMVLSKKETIRILQMNLNLLRKYYLSVYLYSLS